MRKIKELFNLNGKVALVTGGSKGLGYFSAQALAEAGADVAICSRDIHESLEVADKTLKDLGSNSLAIRCDIKNEDEVKKMAQKLKEYYGKCDILVNNAAISKNMPSKNMSLRRWNDVMNTNLTGTFICSREIGKLMIRKKSGVIINISSIAAEKGSLFGCIAYFSTKTGILGLTRKLAVEWGKYNIRVNAILPGVFAEGMTENLKNKDDPLYKQVGEYNLQTIPLGRFGFGEDIKGPIVFLASEASKYISGITLRVDAGHNIFEIL